MKKIKDNSNHNGVIIISTFPNQNAIKSKINNILVTKKICACITFFKVRSFYTWKNKIENQDEIMVLFKTSKEKSEKLKKEIKAIHPYEVPEIIEFVASDIEKNYMKWIIDSMK